MTFTDIRGLVCQIFDPLPTFSYLAPVLKFVASNLQKMSDFEEEQREEVDALVSIFSEEMMVMSLIKISLANCFS